MKKVSWIPVLRSRSNLAKNYRGPNYIVEERGGGRNGFLRSCFSEKVKRGDITYTNKDFAHGHVTIIITFQKLIASISLIMDFSSIRKERKNTASIAFV